MDKPRPDRCEHNLYGVFCAVHMMTGRGKKNPCLCHGRHRECPKKAKRGKGK